MNRHRSWVAAFAIAVLVAACGAAAPSDVPTSPSGSSATPAPNMPSPDPSFEALVAEGIRIRTMLGLRADEAWVREVSADPGARTSYEIPLTLAEEAELDERATNRRELQPILERYGAEHPEDYAGLMIDQEKDGILVVLFSDHLEEHAAAIARLVHPAAKLEVREAGASSAELERLMTRINADGDALRSVGVFVLSISTDEARGKLVVEVSTERGDAQPLLAARYGPAVEVEVTDPTGSYLPPRGEIRGRIVDREGKGVQGQIGSEPLFADLSLDSIGPPDTNADGTFRLKDMLPGEWRLTAFVDGVEAATADVEVTPGDVATIELVVD
jgi:hypothetical protein